MRLLLIKIGKFQKIHGIRGHIKLKSFTKNTSGIKSYKKFFINENTEIKLKFLSKSNEYFICKVNEINSPQVISEFEGKYIFIQENQLPKLKSNEFYYFELENLVVKIKDEFIGKIFAINNHGAGDYIEVKKKNGDLLLVPYNKDHIKNVNLKEKIIELNWLYYLDEI